MRPRPENLIVPIRPHHGMCLAYFKGSGYSQGFTAHMQEMLELFETNVWVRLTAGTDEICSACPNNRQGTCRDADQVAVYDHSVLENCGLLEGTEIKFLDFARLVQEQILDAGKRMEICGDCQWNQICCREKSRFSAEEERLP